MILNDTHDLGKNFQSLSHWLREEKCQVSGKVHSDLHKNKQPNAYFTGYWYQKPVDTSQSMTVYPPEPNTLFGLWYTNLDSYLTNNALRF